MGKHLKYSKSSKPRTGNTFYDGRCTIATKINNLREKCVNNTPIVATQEREKKALSGGNEIVNFNVTVKCNCFCFKATCEQNNLFDENDVISEFRENHS